MKDLYFILLLLLANTFLSAQSYQPLIKENKFWFYKHIHTSECRLLWDLGYSVNYFNGDTIINNIEYTKLIKSTIIPTEPNFSKPYTIITSSTLGYYREDTIEKKVFLLNNGFNFYCLPENTSDEILLWDFSLLPGDTLNECMRNMFLQNIFTEIPPIVDSISEEIDLWGKSRSFFYCTGYQPPKCGDLADSEIVYFLEGYGLPQGPISANLGTQLLLYCEGTFEQCNIILSNTKDPILAETDSIILFPNPTNNYLKINTEINNFTFSILDGHGKVLLESIANELDISGLTPGVYVTKLTTLNNRQYFKKLIKL